MAKQVVEKAPDLDLSRVGEFITHLSKYEVIDAQGRYLHWDQFKWRVPASEAQLAWQAVKFKRHSISKPVGLFDDKEREFRYCTPTTVESKLHEIVKVAGGNVGAIDGNAASENIQKKFLVSSLIMEEAITSAQLEGASITREVAKKMLEEDREPVNEDERMIFNNYLLLRHAERSIGKSLTIDLILEFHEIATAGTTENNVVPGEFRQDDGIYVEDSRGEIAHTPPSFALLQQRLKMLCDFANFDHSGIAFIHPVVKAIILHFMIGYEHPFRDGNGRTARALFYWFMLKKEYDLFKYVSISKLLKNDPKGYGFSFLYTERDSNDLTYFIDYQLDIILAAFEELKAYLANKTDEFNKVVELLENSKFSKLNFVQKDLIKKGTKEPGRIFKVKEISSSYSISENTARGYLNELVTLKLLLQTKDGRAVLYFAPADLKSRLLPS